MAVVSTSAYQEYYNTAVSGPMKEQAKIIYAEELQLTDFKASNPLGGLNSEVPVYIYSCHFKRGWDKEHVPPVASLIFLHEFG